MAKLLIRNIHKSFLSTQVLKGIDLEIADGEFLILVGPSGCGKSTLLNIIAGLEEQTQGDIQIGERVVSDISPKDRNIAMVFQSYALYPSMTVRQNIEFGLRMKKVAVDERAATVERVAKMLQIEALLERRPAQLSGGQRQRVAMGRALARNPEIFLFDEPLSNLDAKLRVEMRAEIKALHQRLKTTVVYVTHDQVEAMTLGDRIAVMRDGSVEQFGTPAQIYDEPASMYVASFMGSPSMNLIRLRLEVRDGQLCAHLKTHLGEQWLVLGRCTHDAWQAQDAVLGLRAEHFSPCADEPGALPITLDMLEPTGADLFATTQINGQKLSLRLPPKPMPALGSTCFVRINGALASIFDVHTEKRLSLFE